MSKPFEKVHTRRLAALAACCVLLFLAASVRTFQFQIVQGEGFRKQVEKSTAAVVSVSAARGEIVDRNGIPFTRNKAAFSVEIDHIFLRKQKQNQARLDNDALNATLLKLMSTFEQMGEEWIDNLPISQTAPYTFIDTEESALQRLRSKLEVETYATPEDCLYWIYLEGGIKKYQNKSGKCTHCGEKFDDCTFIGYSEEDSRKLAGVRYQMMLMDFSRYNNRFTFAEDISAETVALLKELSEEYPGVTISEKAIRTYVSGDVASHLLGKVGPIYAENYDEYVTQKGYPANAIIGISGIERAFEEELRGKNGKMTVSLNSKGDVVSVEESVAPIAGNTIQLTLDYNLQKAVQQILAEYIESYNKANVDKHETKAAAIVVLDVKTGGMLACVSYPYFDINDYINRYSSVAQAEGNPAFNRALNGIYRPGSSFKPLIAAAGMAEGIISPESEIECVGRYMYYAPTYTPSCLNDGHRPGSMQTVTSSLWHSCNIFYFETGRLLTIEKMNHYANMFGFAVPTGLEISNALGYLNTREDENWQEGNVIQEAIGQLNTGVTPLQMAIEAMTLANKGTRYESHLLKAVLSNDTTQVIREQEPVVASQFTLTEEQFKAIADGMVLVGNSIPSPNQLTDLGYPVAVKTGTPQVTKETFNHAFISFAPAYEPEIAVACIMEDGGNSHHMLQKILLAYEQSKKGLPFEMEPDTSDPGTSPGNSSSPDGSVQSNPSGSSENTASETSALSEPEGTNSSEGITSE